MFLCLEGPDGVGKTTQCHLLAKYFVKCGKKVAVVGPGGTPAGNKIRDILLDKSIPLQGKSELLLFTASRCESAAYIQEMLKEGTVVICDRWVLSTLAYQGEQSGEGFIMSLHEYACGQLKPDAMILFEATAEEAFTRKQGMVECVGNCSAPAAQQALKDRFESRERDAWERVVARYEDIPKRMADKLATHVIRIPFGYSVPVVHEYVISGLNAALPEVRQLAPSTEEP